MVGAASDVCIFRYATVQAMFIVTPACVIATDPMSYARPEASTVYIEEIRKVTNQPKRSLPVSCSSSRQAVEPSRSFQRA